MADNPQVRAGTAGGTIVVVADEITSPYTGDTAQAQGIKILDGAADGTRPARVTTNNELLTFVGNNGTVSVTGTPNVHITNAATATLTGTNPVTLLNNGTVIQGTNPWQVRTWQDHASTVIVSSISLPGGITGFAEDAQHTSGDAGIPAMAVRKNEAAALAGADADYTPLISGPTGGLWTHVAAGTVTIAALPAGTNNIGDVDVASIASGDNNIGNVDIVTVPADPFGANADAAVSAGATGSIQAKLRRISSDIDAIKTAVETLDNTVGGSELQVDVVTLPALPAGNNNIGDVDAIQSGTWTVQPGNTANTTAWLVGLKRGATSALTTVADSASSATILAANSGRIRATITNDSSARLYLRFEAAAASTSNYAVSLAQHECWVENEYTGEIRGIWASDPGDGAARVTEISA